MTTLENIQEEFGLLEADDRYRLLIDLGRQLPEMPSALKTSATLVRGCSASVWVYPAFEKGHINFLADSNTAITKGIIALILKTIEGKDASQILGTDIDNCLLPFKLESQLSSNRTQGIPNMIAIIRSTAMRLIKEH
ncbi:SufE family protein [Sphingorhabdus sp.]|uniref:SufE family protein n=1 Tax=Sphingorhabdus sp. TaxID=1902408 RepID=UPI003D8184DC